MIVKTRSSSTVNTTELLARKILGRLKNYSSCFDTKVSLSDCEEGCVGVYTNKDGSCISIFKTYIKIFNCGEIKMVEFGEITSLSLHSDSGIKSDTHGIKVVCGNSEEKFIPILGGEGRFRDAFEFLRFLMRRTGQ